MTVRHMVLFRLNDDVARDDPRVTAAVAASASLRKSVPGGSSWRIGPDTSGRDVAADFGGVGDFESADVLAEFFAHPNHVAAAAKWAGLATLTICDLSLPESS